MCVRIIVVVVVNLNSNFTETEYQTNNRVQRREKVKSRSGHKNCCNFRHTRSLIGETILIIKKKTIFYI